MSKARNGVNALYIDSLIIQRGETLTIVGPNGAGKSTLLLALAHLLASVRGEILYDGKSLKQWNELESQKNFLCLSSTSVNGNDGGAKYCLGLKIPPHLER